MLPGHYSAHRRAILGADESLCIESLRWPSILRQFSLGAQGAAVVPVIQHITASLFPQYRMLHMQVLGLLLGRLQRTAQLEQSVLLTL
ncbi:hypothetical protein D3C76_1188100 [compost metagenome]